MLMSNVKTLTAVVWAVGIAWSVLSEVLVADPSIAVAGNRYFLIGTESVSVDAANLIFCISR